MTIGKKIGTGFGVILILLGAVGGIAYKSVTGAITEFR